ncbi:DUF2461 domain-containing protein [Granulicella mallensis]|uniref:Uncharacterized protein (TIGR02453 family) n=1 Tax=Granulicella mallensis TaxID=940614 RepID=A0A7W8EAT4_9BACT|nr:DUF2461 domain-containing protein [Granulicella mallensis]MBB5065056.1 uncharacterized protein (TIGR02453 family) [Granulicella mallensis]
MPAHFTPETLKFLRGLARYNDREWFEARRDIYDRALKQPMLAFIDEINKAMDDFAPEHVRPANKTMMRIYRDTRFSSDKRPYKRQVAAWWARRGMEKTSGGGFYLHVSPKEVHISAGVYMPEREQLLAIRRWLAEHHEEYRALQAAILKPRARSAGSKIQPPMSGIDSSSLTRMPKGFPADHPADELLRAKNWGVQVSLPSEIALDPALLQEAVQRFRLAAPLVHALNGAILEASEAVRKPSRPLF